MFKMIALSQRQIITFFFFSLITECYVLDFIYLFIVLNFGYFIRKLSQINTYQVVLWFLEYEVKSKKWNIRFVFVLSCFKICVCIAFIEKYRTRLVHMFKHMFSVFKQHYTYFHTLFYPHVFPINTNNVTRITLSNKPYNFW